ncbi:MAG: hypothetical protein NT166_22100 [Candidatus Aminicenantes bacterium]|nr:hypothetical protein [Candidatus Aminicenantes bacterium]
MVETLRATSLRCPGHNISTSPRLHRILHPNGNRRLYSKFVCPLSLYNVMKAVLEEDPQMKEKLGIVTPIEV